MATKKKKQPVLIYALPSSTLIIGKQAYKLGDVVTDWSDDLKDKHCHCIRPLRHGAATLEAERKADAQAREKARKAKGK